MGNKISINKRDLKQYTDFLQQGKSENVVRKAFFRKYEPKFKEQTELAWDTFLADYYKIYPKKNRNKRAIEDKRSIDETEKPALQIIGRTGYNKAINGHYLLGDEIHNGRVYYFRETKEGGPVWFIRWRPSKKMWLIDLRESGELPTEDESTCQAFCKQDVENPGLLTRGWKVFADGKFKEDPRVKVQIEDIDPLGMKERPSDTDPWAAILDEIQGPKLQPRRDAIRAHMKKMKGIDPMTDDPWKPTYKCVGLYQEKYEQNSPRANTACYWTILMNQEQENLNALLPPMDVPEVPFAATDADVVADTPLTGYDDIERLEQERNFGSGHSTGSGGHHRPSRSPYVTQDSFRQSMPVMSGSFSDTRSLGSGMSGMSGGSYMTNMSSGSTFIDQNGRVSVLVPAQSTGSLIAAPVIQQPYVMQQPVIQQQQYMMQQPVSQYVTQQPVMVNPGGHFGAPPTNMRRKLSSGSLASMGSTASSTGSKYKRRPTARVKHKKRGSRKDG